MFSILTGSDRAHRWNAIDSEACYSRSIIALFYLFGNFAIVISVLIVLSVILLCALTIHTGVFFPGQEF